tara:strand:- start:252 stop:656 length:405 start_codon:yes stop_codon:yes gene_type:complete
MKDVYLERKDQEIERLKDDYWRVGEGDGEAILFDMLVKIDDKATYIAEHPERAKNHYSKSRDAAFVKSVRTSLGLTQEAFGYRLGVSREIVNRWERGRVPLSEDKRILIESVMRFADPNPSWKKDIINSLWRGV